MAAVCPTVTAYDEASYSSQMEMVRQFAERIHIDLMDGDFAPTISPPLDKIWWPAELIADIHVMYRRPGDYLQKLIGLKPHLVVIQAESDVDHTAFAARLHEAGIKAGLALLQTTTVTSIEPILAGFDHLMIFSGNLGYHGGSAVDFGLLDKAGQARRINSHIEVAWDGGISDRNAKELVEGGIDVLNVGGFIHKAEDPRTAYERLLALVR